MLLDVGKSLLQFRLLVDVGVKPVSERNDDREGDYHARPEENSAEEPPYEINLVSLAAAEGLVPVGEARPRHVWIAAVSLKEEVQEPTEGVLVERVV
jgi:hypothetical protein